MRLSLESDLEVMGEAADVASAIALARVVRPDAIILDVVASCLDGLEATIELARRTSGAPVIMLSLLDDCRTAQQTIAAGAAAFVGKQESVDRLLETIRRVVGPGDARPSLSGRAA